MTSLIRNHRVRSNGLFRSRKLSSKADKTGSYNTNLEQDRLFPQPKRSTLKQLNRPEPASHRLAIDFFIWVTCLNLLPATFPRSARHSAPGRPRPPPRWWREGCRHPSLFLSPHPSHPLLFPLRAPHRVPHTVISNHTPPPSLPPLHTARSLINNGPLSSSIRLRGGAVRAPARPRAVYFRPEWIVPEPEWGLGWNETEFGRFRLAGGDSRSAYVLDTSSGCETVFSASFCDFICLDRWTRRSMSFRDYSSLLASHKLP